jgi:uncharacterized ion transporter superfamily protein YfcC
MKFNILNIFGSKPSEKVYFYPLMYSLNLRNNFDALVAEWAIRYLNEQMGMSMKSITPSLVTEIAAFAKSEARRVV